MAENYFKNHKLLENVVHIEDPLGVFTTLIIGQNKALLFDTGFGVGNLRQQVEGLTKLPLIVVNSHGHVDHICGNYLFDEIYIHENDIEVSKLHTSRDMRMNTVKQAKSKGILPKDFDKETYLSAGTGNLLPIKEGHCFDLGGITLEVITVPGHTRGSIGLLCKEQGFLLLGDAANSFLYLFLPESTNVDEYIRTLRKINSLDFDNFIISHHAGLLPKSKINDYIECATSIDIEKSKPYDFPPFKELKALIYSHGDRDISDPHYTSIIYTVDRL